MASPFEDLRQILSQLPEGDASAAKKVNVEPSGEAGVHRDGLHELKQWLAVWQGSSSPEMSEAHICVLASCYAGADSAVVRSFIEAASKGQAPVNRLCVDQGVGLRVLELAPDMPYDPSVPWDQAECMAAVAFGMEATAAGGHLLALSDYAPGNVLPALAICASLGRNSIQGLRKSLESTVQAEVEADILAKLWLLLDEWSGEELDPLELLRTYGGREIAASVGAIVAARSRRMPMIVDGWSAIAAIAVLEAEQPGSTDHVLVASSPDLMAELFAEKLGKKRLLGFSVAAGAGCGNAVSVSLLKAACDL